LYFVLYLVCIYACAAVFFIATEFSVNKDLHNGIHAGCVWFSSSVVVFVTKNANIIYKRTQRSGKAQSVVAVVFFHKLYIVLMQANL